MSKKNKSQAYYSEIKLREMLGKAELSGQVIDKAIADYTRYRKSESSSLAILSYSELQSLGEATKDILRNRVEDKIDTILSNYIIYLRYKVKIAETYQESKSWDIVATTVVFRDVYYSHEAFIEYIAETYQTEIRDAKHLQELTGITEVDLEGLEDTLTGFKYAKYYKALQSAIQEGAKYKDLLEINPLNFGLPESWKEEIAPDQYNSILYTIDEEFFIENILLALQPDPRSIAKDLDAPYSVIMDCYNLVN